MSKIIIALLVIAAIAGGVYALKGGGQTQLGAGVPEGAQITEIGKTIGDVKAQQGKEVTVKGEITEKCPTTGCWFYIKDSTGQIRVDTAPSGFTIADVPVGKTLTVHGKVIVTEGGDAELVATGAK